MVDHYLIIYGMFATAEIGLALLIGKFVVDNVSRTKIWIIGITLSILMLGQTIAVLLPIKAEVEQINDCIYFYGEYGPAPLDYNMTFLKRCDLTKAQIHTILESKNNLYGRITLSLNDSKYKNISWENLSFSGS